MPTHSLPAGTLVDIPTWVRPSQHLQTVSSHRTKPKPSMWLFSDHSSASFATWVGIGMVVALMLMLLGQVVVGWTTMELDQWRYGYPRTYQTNAYVGQQETPGHPSHFIALNDNGQVEVIEFPGDHASQARIFLGPQLTGPQADLAPVTLQFVANHGNHYPDMLVHVEDITLRYLNTQETFQLSDG